MEVWEWLRPWWNWWADFTALFYWPAISALMSSAAIFFTIRLADRTRRDGNRRDAAYLRGVAGTFEALSATVSVPGDGVGDAEFEAECRALHFAWKSLGVRYLLDEIDLKAVANTQAFGLIVQGKAAARVLDNFAQRFIDEGRVPSREAYAQRFGTLSSTGPMLRKLADTLHRPNRLDAARVWKSLRMSLGAG